MSSIAQASRPVLNRRRRVRQRIHAPAYATFTGAPRNGMLDLCEVIDISEVGVAVQCPAPMEVNQEVELSLDLSDATGQISTTARVAWSDSAGRVGFGLTPLTGPVLRRMREWLFLNAMAAAANATSSNAAPPMVPEHAKLRPTYTDTLNAASAVQKEAESLGSDLEAVLALVASRAQSLLRASGAAIAMAGNDSATMTCRASAGESAPPVGAALQIGSGFSGECVRTGKILRCEDSETDELVDRESCRALGIRSMLAAPIRLGGKVIGLLEVFSAQAGAFSEKDGAVLRCFTETILSAIHRAAREHDPAPPLPAAPKPFVPAPGSVLFAHMPEETTEKKEEESLNTDVDEVGGIRLPRAHLYLLVCAAATIFLALGFILAPWIQEKIRTRDQNSGTVLASSRAPGEAAKSSPDTSVDFLDLKQLRDLAESGNAAAEDRLGRLYAEGDERQGIKPDDKQAAHWFTSAAEHGSISAQYKLGLLYWGGHHGLPKDTNRAYFWTVLARAGGQEGSKDLATVLANGMTHSQSAAIEQQAEIWYRQHEPQAKPNPGH